MNLTHARKAKTSKIHEGLRQGYTNSKQLLRRLSLSCLYVDGRDFKGSSLPEVSSRLDERMVMQLRSGAYAPLRKASPTSSSLNQ